jgi:hypothetical protein
MYGGAFSFGRLLFAIDLVAEVLPPAGKLNNKFLGHIDRPAAYPRAIATGK